MGESLLEAGRASKKERVLAALAAVGRATNHYDLLAASGIEHDWADTEQWAKKAQKGLTLLLHPDQCSKLALGRDAEEAATEAFQGMQAAFEVLSDGAQRTKYDLILAKEAAEREETARREAEAVTKREQDEAAARSAAEEAARREAYRAELRRLQRERKEREKGQVLRENRLRIARFEENERKRCEAAATGSEAPAAAPATSCRFVHAAAGTAPAKSQPRAPPGRMAGLCGGAAAGATAIAPAPQGPMAGLVPPGRMAGLCGGGAPAATPAAPPAAPPTAPPGRMAGLMPGPAHPRAKTDKVSKLAARYG